MRVFYDIIKKFSLYIVAMSLAFAIFYFFGLSPVLKAQDAAQGVPSSGPQDPDLSMLPEQTSVSAPVINGAADDQAPLQGDLIDIDVPSEAQQNPKLNATEQLHTEDGEKSVDSTSKSTLFKYTKSYVGDINNSERDPFRKPMYLLELEEVVDRPIRTEEGRIDQRMEAIRRWPLREYRLIGIIWDVQSPKAMILDPANTMHMLKRNYRIGDRDGLISAIGEGSITVIQDNVPVVINIERKLD